ncbi:hypothetical protein [Salinactinospora qingdaonensis]|uniref:DUF3558 domain-containing protein n=1 Tax=Salinactinospora qingdaonensis TaxID=702744 RepID=A0ABP7G727_9ACTN
MSGMPSRSRFKAPRLGFAAVALAALAAGCSGSGAADAFSSEGGPSPQQTYDGVVAAAKAPGPEGFVPTEIEGVKINAPEGWQVDDSGDSLCMRPPGQQNCDFGAVQVFPHAAQRHPANWPKKDDAFNQDNGWAAQPNACRSAGTARAGNVAVTASTQTTQGFTTHADGLKSHHSVWQVECENGDTFEVRMWFLPKSDVVVYVWAVDPRYAEYYDQIAASMDVTAYNS